MKYVGSKDRHGKDIYAAVLKDGPVTYTVLEGIGCHKVRSVPLIPVAFLGHGVFGKAKGGKIYLSKRTFAAGFTNLVGTLFEEYQHVESGFEDCNRDFQNFLMDTIARLAIKMNEREVTI